MDLESSEIDLLNDISENGNYLEDSSDEVRDQVSNIIRDAEISEVEQLEPDLLKKLLNGNSYPLSDTLSESESHIII